MEERVYESKRQVTLKDGTIREYTTRSTYKPKGVKEARKGDIIDLIKQINDREKLKKIKEFIINERGDSKNVENQV
jgi:hypothetical protein